MNETARPGAAQATTMPRSVAAPRQLKAPRRQEVREAPGAPAQAPSLNEPALTWRAVSQETPVTRSSPTAAALPLHTLTLEPAGAS